jgi:hypothetical protein
MSRSADTSSILFSDRLQDSRIQSLTRRITAKASQALRTQAFRPAADESAEAYWLEATRGIDDSWTVKKFTTVSADIFAANGAKPAAGALPPSRDQTVITNACFFDALYFCAEFEKGEAALGNAVDETLSARLALPHLGATAAAEYMPTDLATGMPAPAAGGQILIDGVYSAEDRGAALLTKDNLRETLPAVTGTYHVAAASNGAERALELFQKNGNRRDLVYRIGQEAGTLSRAFNFAMGNKFRSRAMGTTPLLTGAGVYAGLMGTVYQATGGSILALFMAGMFGGLMTAAATGIYCEDLRLQKSPLRSGGMQGFPHRRFGKALRAFNASVAQLPDGALKAELGQVSAEIELGYRILTARESFRRAAAKGGFFAGRRRDADLRRFVSTAARQGLSVGETMKCLAQIEQNPKDLDYDMRLATLLIEKGVDAEKAFSKVSREQADEMILKGLPKNSRFKPLPVAGRAGGIHTYF